MLIQEEDSGSIELKSAKGQFEFRDLNFSYQTSKKQVLCDINFNVDAGQTIALVGSSGSGKSSLVNLIPRFYNLKQGSILLDDKDIKDYSLASLRQQIAIVSQKVTLFNSTIYSNIAYGDLADKSAKQVKAAAKMANAHEFIENLPDGYETLIGDDGVMLSGGHVSVSLLLEQF